jgi:hypothetical protein
MSTTSSYDTSIGPMMKRDSAVEEWVSDILFKKGTVVRVGVHSVNCTAF